MLLLLFRPQPYFVVASFLEDGNIRTVLQLIIVSLKVPLGQISAIAIVL